MLLTLVLTIFFFSSVIGDCICTPITDYCVDGYVNTCGSSFPCDIIRITTDNYALTQTCIDSYSIIPILEVSSNSFTLQSNYFETSGGLSLQTNGELLWYGFNNFEQINKITYNDNLNLTFRSPFEMTSGQLFISKNINLDLDSSFKLKGDSYVEFGGSIDKEQLIMFNSGNTELYDNSILNLSTATLLNPYNIYLTQNSKLIISVIGEDASNCIIYLYDSSSFIVDEDSDVVYMPFQHEFRQYSQLIISKNTNSYFSSVFLYDFSSLNICENSFIAIDFLQQNSNEQIEIGENSVLKTQPNTLYGEIIFNNKARLTSTNDISSISNFKLTINNTIIGYPIISLWSENSIISNINEVNYNGIVCIDVYSFALSNYGLTLPSNYYKLANDQLIRYCPSSVDYDVHCYLNNSIWSNDFIDSNGYPIFISPHCMNSYYSNYLCHSVQNTFEVGNDLINITFVEVLHTIIISEPTSNQQIINGRFNIIETTFGLKINQNNNATTLKGEIVEPNTFISIQNITTTIYTINNEIQLDLTLMTSTNTSYLLNATIIEVIDDSIVTLENLISSILFINSKYYQINVEFTQNEIGLYSKNGFDINGGNICYCLLFTFILKILI
ncbi:hypothetical protein QTN25_006968 [Entamoeba marina]